MKKIPTDLSIFSILIAFFPHCPKCTHWFSELNAVRVYEMVFVCFLVLNRNSIDRKISRRILMPFLHSFVMCVSHGIMFALKFGETQLDAHN